MDELVLTQIAEREDEGPDLDFKSGFDQCSPQDWCEVIKDLVAMANSGGGAIVFGVNDDGTPSAEEVGPILAIDNAMIGDKVAKYVGQDFNGFTLSSATRGDRQVAVMCIDSVPIPLVFTSPGSYAIADGKQKTAFAKGTVYFRHGSKSEPGTTDDLRNSLNRELDRVRSSWLDGIAKVVTAPVGATISVLSGEVKLTGVAEATSVRLVNDENAPAFKAVRTDLLYPYRQKELVKRVNALVPGFTLTAHDVYCVRKAHLVDSQPHFFYKPQYSSPQYSEAFATWMASQYSNDTDFFQKARKELKRHETTPSSASTGAASDMRPSSESARIPLLPIASTLQVPGLKEVLFAASTSPKSA